MIFRFLQEIGGHFSIWRGGHTTIKRVAGGVCH